MIETGHDDRSLLDVLAPLMVVEDDQETPEPFALKPRSAVQGAIIGQLLPRFAGDELPEALDLDSALEHLSRAYLDV